MINWLNTVQEADILTASIKRHRLMYRTINRNLIINNKRTNDAKRERTREDPGREKDIAKEKDRNIFILMKYAIENKRKMISFCMGREEKSSKLDHDTIWIEDKCRKRRRRETN
jgi:hypothetical protein